MNTPDENRASPDEHAEPPEKDVPDTDHPTGEQQAEENARTELPG